MPVGTSWNVNLPSIRDREVYSPPFRVTIILDAGSPLGMSNSPSTGSVATAPPPDEGELPNEDSATADDVDIMSAIKQKIWKSPIAMILWSGKLILKKIENGSNNQNAPIR